MNISKRLKNWVAQYLELRAAVEEREMRHFLKKGVGAVIASIILILIFFGVLFGFYFALTNSVLAWQQTYYSAGTFIQDYLTFNTNIITWWPILFILMPLVVWGLLQAMRRRPSEVDSY